MGMRGYGVCVCVWECLKVETMTARPSHSLAVKEWHPISHSLSGNVTNQAYPPEVTGSNPDLVILRF